VFLQDPEGLEVSAPEAYGYEFQSHGVVEMLEKLLDEFIAERAKLKKEEQSCLATPEEHIPRECDETWKSLPRCLARAA